MNYIEDSLNRKIIFLTGKGGVGKTTLAWATALACIQKGKSVAIASWNPYGSESSAHPEIGAQWIALETFDAFREYINKILHFDSIYKVVFDNHIFKTFVKAAPGLSETVIAGKLSNHFLKDENRIIIVDLPSSGHAISFFQSPQGIQKLFKAGFVHSQANEIIEMFESDKCRIDLVSIPEELPVQETLELKSNLSQLYSFNFGFLHWNQHTPQWDIPKTIEGASSSLATSIENYHQSLNYEKQLLAQIEEIKLPILPISRQAVDGPLALIEAIAENYKRHE